jgi:hypothetical protein
MQLSINLWRPTTISKDMAANKIKEKVYLEFIVEKDIER